VPWQLGIGGRCPWQLYSEFARPAKQHYIPSQPSLNLLHYTLLQEPGDTQIPHGWSTLSLHCQWHKHLNTFNISPYLKPTYKHY